MIARRYKAKKKKDEGLPPGKPKGEADRVLEGHHFRACQGGYNGHSGTPYNLANVQRVGGSVGARSFKRACHDVIILCNRCHDRVHPNGFRALDLPFPKSCVQKTFLARGVSFALMFWVGEHLSEKCLGQGCVRMTAEQQRAFLGDPKRIPKSKRKSS